MLRDAFVQLQKDEIIVTNNSLYTYILRKKGLDKLITIKEKERLKARILLSMNALVKGGFVEITPGYTDKKVYYKIYIQKK